LLCHAVTLPNAADTDKASATLTGMLNADRRVLQSPPPAVFVEGRSGANGIVLTCSFRASQDKLGEIQPSIIAEVKRQLEAVGIENLVPQQIVRTAPADTDPSRLLAMQNRSQASLQASNAGPRRAQFNPDALAETATAG